MNFQNQHSSQVSRYYCYSSEYQSMYEPSYQILFVFLDEDEFDDADGIEDLLPLTDPGTGQA
jgi:hypothetical protein